MCDLCIIQRICLAFVAPDLDLRLCCESLTIDEKLLRRFIADRDVCSYWRRYWDLADSSVWTCPEGHVSPRKTIMEDESGLTFWRELMSCDQCSHLTRHATYCLFCSRKVYGASCNKCAHELVIWPFILRLKANRTFYIPWIRDAIDHALNARPVTMNVTSAADRRESRRSKQKRRVKNNLPSWEFLDSEPPPGLTPSPRHFRGSQAPPGSEEVRGEHARNKQTREIQYHLRARHSEGRIEASGAYAWAPGDCPLERVRRLLGPTSTETRPKGPPQAYPFYADPRSRHHDLYYA